MLHIFSLSNYVFLLFIGTLATKAMASVRKETGQQFLLEKVLPPIKEKWPAEEKGMPIFIQQDNAKTHIDVNDLTFVESVQADGWDIRLTCQPPNSPDLNVMETLGSFLEFKLSGARGLRVIHVIVAVRSPVNSTNETFFCRLLAVLIAARDSAINTWSWSQHLIAMMHPRLALGRCHAGVKARAKQWMAQHRQEQSR
jgi:hypothetical protein